MTNKKCMKKTAVALMAVLVFALTAGCGSSPSSTPGSPEIAAREAYNAGDLYHLAGQERWDLVIRMLNEGSYKNINSQQAGFYNVAIGGSTGFYGSSTLAYASSSGRLDVVRLLVQKGADKNIRSRTGYTALMFAAHNGYPDIIRYLVEQGANVNLRNDDGETAASIAYDKGEVDIYDYLMANGAREFNPLQVAQQSAAPAPQTNVYVQPSAPAQSAAPAQPSPSTPTLNTGTYAANGTNMTMHLNLGQVMAYIGRDAIAYGTYRINGSQLVITFDARTPTTGAGAPLRGNTYIYTITSNASFSSSGENWARTGY